MEGTEAIKSWASHMKLYNEVDSTIMKRTQAVVPYVRLSRLSSGCCISSGQIR